MGDVSAARSLLIAVLSVGTVLGYGFGFRAMHQAHGRREAFERHVANLCVDAAEGARSRPSPPP